MFKIAVLASGGGSNFQSIIDNIESGFLNAKIEILIGSKEGIYALDRARKHGIKNEVISKKIYGENFGEKMLEVLDGKVDLIVLAGYLSILDGKILEVFKDRIINIHPSLIPSFCGKGMYGIKVHEEAIKKGVKFSGCTVHFVNNEVDGGAIILQDIVEVSQDDTAKTLQEKVLVKEHKILPLAIKYISEEKLLIKNGRVNLKK